MIDERTDLDHMTEDAALSLTAAFAPHAAQGIAQVPGLERDQYGRMQHETEDFTAGVERISAEARYAELTDGKDARGLVVLPAGVYRASPTRVSRLWSEPRPGTMPRS